jgi:hypothetical protein
MDAFARHKTGHYLIGPPSRMFQGVPQQFVPEPSARKTKG